MRIPALLSRRKALLTIGLSLALTVLFQNCTPKETAVSLDLRSSAGESAREPARETVNLPVAVKTTTLSGTVIRDGTSLIPAYATSAACQKIIGASPGEDHLSFAVDLAHGKFSARTNTGRTLWALAKPSAVDFSGGFDLNQDGCIDLGLVHATVVGSCGTSVVSDRWVEVYSGATGNLLVQTGKVRDHCWTSLNYATISWYAGSFFFGAANALALIPQYGETGWFYRGVAAGNILSPGAFFLPTSPSFDAAYPSAQPNAWGTGTKYVKDSMPPNGLIANVAGAPRLISFSSGRVSQYAVSALGPGQLVKDTTFVARSDIAGRQYGRLQIDEKSGKLFRAGGAPAAILLSDVLDRPTEQSCAKNPASAGKKDAWACYADPWAGIERAVLGYDLQSGAVEQRFFSYAHDVFNGAADGYRFEKRLTYPARMLADDENKSAHLVFNEFTGGHWRIHVTAIGSTRDLVVIPDLYVWDIADLDQDGAQEWIVSPVAQGAKNHLGQSFYPEWKTDIMRFSAATGSLKLIQTITGKLPQLGMSAGLNLRRFHEALSAESAGLGNPVSTVTTADGSGLSLIMISEQDPKKFKEEPLRLRPQ